MSLCGRRRIEGFGPISHTYSGILTSCFLDTVLIPLCTWLYLATLLILLLLSRRRRPSPSTSPQSDNGAEEESKTRSAKRVWTGGSKIQKACLGLYCLLVIAQILMCILEITRLSIAGLGIGLLPFTIVSLAIAVLLRLSSGLNGRVWRWKWANLALWAELGIVTVVKIVEEGKELKSGRRRDRDSGMAGKYKVEDEITDVAVMLGVYLALGILEWLLKDS